MGAQLHVQKARTAGHARRARDFQLASAIALTLLGVACAGNLERPAGAPAEVRGGQGRATETFDSNARGVHEICGNQKDDDGDGDPDEGCACEPGASQRCTLSEAKYAAHLGCAGVQTCTDAGESSGWGSCEPSPDCTPCVVDESGHPRDCTQAACQQLPECAPDPCDVLKSLEWSLDDVMITKYFDNLIDRNLEGLASSVSPCPFPNANDCDTWTIVQRGFRAGTVWTRGEMRADEAGDFNLCYSVRAGDAKHPTASDCLVGRTCIRAKYKKPGEWARTAALLPFVATDAACIARVAREGMYGEMSFWGSTSQCDALGSEAHPIVFNASNYCDSICNDDPRAPGCEGCGTAAAGHFQR